jgi:hypothetical protein
MLLPTCASLESRRDLVGSRVYFQHWFLETQDEGKRLHTFVCLISVA